ncbi:hypothetical protein L9F63_024233, partial [Diploptera punctata]
CKAWHENAMIAVKDLPPGRITMDGWTNQKMFSAIFASNTKKKYGKKARINLKNKKIKQENKKTSKLQAMTNRSWTNTNQELRTPVGLDT